MTNLQFMRTLPAGDLAILLNTIIDEGVCDYCGRRSTLAPSDISCAGEKIPNTLLHEGCVEGLHAWLNQEVSGAFWNRPDGHRVWLSESGCTIE